MPKRWVGKVSVICYWEVSCDGHGVVDMTRTRDEAEKLRRQHFLDHPECRLADGRRLVQCDAGPSIPTSQPMKDLPT